MARARFSDKKGSFEPSGEVNRNMLKSGVDPAILLHTGVDRHLYGRKLSNLLFRIFNENLCGG